MFLEVKGSMSSLGGFVFLPALAGIQIKQVNLPHYLYRFVVRHVQDHFCVGCADVEQCQFPFGIHPLIHTGDSTQDNWFKIVPKPPTFMKTNQSEGGSCQSATLHC